MLLLNKQSFEGTFLILLNSGISNKNLNSNHKYMPYIIYVILLLHGNDASGCVAANTAKQSPINTNIIPRTKDFFLFINISSFRLYFTQYIHNTALFYLLNSSAFRYIFPQNKPTQPATHKQLTLIFYNNFLYIYRLHYLWNPIYAPQTAIKLFVA